VWEKGEGRVLGGRGGGPRRQERGGANFRVTCLCPRRMTINSDVPSQTKGTAQGLPALGVTSCASQEFPCSVLRSSWCAYQVPERYRSTSSSFLSLGTIPAVNRKDLRQAACCRSTRGAHPVRLEERCSAVPKAPRAYRPWHKIAGTHFSGHLRFGVGSSSIPLAPPA